MHAAPAWDPQRHHPDPNPMAKGMKTMILEAATRGRLSGSASEPASPSQPENARAAARSDGEDGEHKTFPGVSSVARSDGARRSAEAPRAVNASSPPATFGGWDQPLDPGPLRVGQVTRVAQPVPIVPLPVLGRPHKAPRESTPGQRITEDSTSSSLPRQPT
jgi:hypothetical protein